ncbi:prolipoprotein diacylglyceryl transferase [Microlunatus soli]|uniref:Phosphatidylglycerol--prolipoprotein diacylglyceryl transferase n=1 Tax=Microlunatus soli TaxID=630515 RepID=A0A1H2A447_9ACTN|nr:prolipoprotein diacylglyceryl transferase [Microlunatus soli]SDT40735.1 prolipoprotein diacylglyceryl transferase [Microlunatus soli]
MVDHLLPALSIPSPPISEWVLFGRVPIRFYALCIITGVVVGVIIATRRWMARGGSRDAIETVALVAVPFGIVGARIYHVITDHQLYFGPGKDPIRALYLWEGGLGIWGGVALGAVGGYLVARRRKIRFWALADAMAPGVAVAQAIGRLGNWFNQELFGRPSTLPWALQIDPQFRPVGYEQYATFHPTFLYELIWNLGVAAVIIALDRRFKLGHGKVFMLYVMLYTAGRAWVEHLRIDPAHTIGGFRLNDYVSVGVFLAALICLLWLIRNKPGREPIVEGDFVYVNGQPPEGDDDATPTSPDPESPDSVSGDPESGAAESGDQPDGAGKDPEAGDHASADNPAPGRARM